ncbi:MAG: glycosyltransferase family 39 protein, partial [Rhodospirillales bacterium]
MAESASRLSRLLDRNLAILTDQPGPPLVVGAIIMAMALIRTTLFPGTGGDDGEQLIFSQFFAWGYQVRNPPLYTWLVMAVSQVTGPGLWAVNIVKFSLLYAMYLFLWRAALRLFATRALAGLAALAPVLFYFVAWEVVTGFSHTVLTACLYAAVLWILLRQRDSPQGRLGDYALLGVAIGLGGLAKYAFWIFLICLLAAALADRDLRRRLLSPWLVLSLAVAAAVLAPHYLWLADRLDILAAQAGDTAAAQGGFSLTGLGHGVKAAAGFLSPFWLIALICFPAAFRPLKAPDHPMIRVLGLYMVLVLAVTAVGTLIQPDFRIRTHYMFVLLFAPVWVLLRAEAAGAPIPRQR